MGQESIKTDPVVVNVHKEPRRKNVTTAAAGTTAGLLLGLIGFFSTYVFVTKAELTAHEKTSDGTLYAIQRDQAIAEAEIKQIHERIREITDEQKELRLGQRVTNRNLEKLLRRSRIRPAKRSDIEQEIEE